MAPKSRKPDGDRQVILDYLYQEMIGPSDSKRTKPLRIDLEAPFFETAEAAAGPWHDELSGEEILSGIRPRQRYGAGILYPVGLDLLPAEDTEEAEDSESNLQPFENLETSQIDDESTRQFEEVVPEETESESQSSRLPSSMGLSFFVLVEEGEQKLQVDLSGGFYEPFQIQAGYRKIPTETWYVRRRYEKSCIIDLSKVEGLKKAKKLSAELLNEAKSPLKIEVEALVRPWGENHFLITVSVVNQTKSDGNSSLLFQTECRVSALDCRFKPYPESSIRTSNVEHETYRAKAKLDDLSTELLFRNYPTYAIGHNCSADWVPQENGAFVIRGNSFPTFETPSITSEIRYSNGKKPTLSMLRFSQSTEKEHLLEELTQLIEEYEKWIEREKSIFTADSSLAIFTDAFNQNIFECKEASRRMRKGLDLLKQDPLVLRAFQLANLAILKQQIRSRLNLRSTSIGDDGRLKVEGETPSPILEHYLDNKWRPFQVAFILNVIESISNDESVDRDIVDLIFFPTGGGKTEAYLGVIAFTILLKRLRNPSDDGTTVIMRYTLRLLTTQQFLRAASLICALEDERRANPSTFGSTPISIGAWLGGGVTPNRREDARQKLSKLTDKPGRKSRKAENPFLVLQCPWCAAEFGQVKSKKTDDLRRKPSGYVETMSTPRTVEFRCPDLNCAFSSALPLYVIDEDVYRNEPTLVIGTVDKFAQMSWKSRAQSIFGRNSDGIVHKSPPSLIIQDEFHLISGPLGSMVGHYETVVEELCTKYENGKTYLPKIISSTATIRRFWAQANAIYGRERVSLFPPPLLDISDSFFSVWSRDDSTLELKPGRLYVGVFAPGLGSVRSAQVRAGAALSYAPILCDGESRDPWWTNLWFFNSLKELGNTIALFQIDIRNYMRRQKTRDGLSEERRLREPLELTSRRRNSEIPEILKQLGNKYPPSKTNLVWDNCLASNIIEVGIDIDRLSLMTVVSQPKSTSQYIQVTGRVGRKPEERPGLVIVIYAFGRPRDLSHFEHFRSYHETIYSQVEPTSVTPFALPVVKRALRGALTALIRMNSPEDLKPNELSEETVRKYGEIFKSRVARIKGVSNEERENLSNEISRVIKELLTWQRTEWEGDDGMLVRQGLDQEIPDFTWTIPSSMRNVDASVGLMITTSYHNRGEQ